MKPSTLDLEAMRERYQYLLDRSGVCWGTIYDFLIGDVSALLAEIERLQAELTEAHTVRKVTEKHSFEVRAEIEQLRQERDELAAALQRLNRLVVGWWLREIAGEGE